MEKMCSKCGVNPKSKSHSYCYGCLRIARGQSPIPKFRRESENKTMCSKCKVKPRYKSHRYCRECKNAATVEWQKANGGSWAVKNIEEKHKAVVRKYAHTLLLAGKVKRGNCAFCGEPGTQFHHFDYEPKTRNFVDVCDACHAGAHNFLKAMRSFMLAGVRFKFDSISQQV